MSTFKAIQGWLDSYGPAVSYVGAGAALAVLFVWDPATTSVFPPCPFRALTGYYCAGCGSLRATHQLLHGHLATAFHLNPLMVLCLPFLGYAVLAARWPSLQIGWVNRLARRPSWPLMVLAVLLLYWVLRNLPFAPFSSLAPHLPPVASSQL